MAPLLVVSIVPSSRLGLCNSQAKGQRLPINTERLEREDQSVTSFQSMRDQLRHLVGNNSDYYSIFAFNPLSLTAAKSSLTNLMKSSM